VATEVISAQIAGERIGTLMRRLPQLRRFLGRDILIQVIRRGLDEIVGGTLKKNGPNAALGRYFGATMRGRWADTGAVFYTGLPAEDEQARILAHRNSGGTIFPKADRPNPHLRIPLPAALTPDGWERRSLGGVLLRNSPEQAKAFRLQPTRAGKALLIDRRSGVPWYVLQKSVTQKPYPWWDRAVANVERDLVSTIEGALERWKGAK